MPKAESRKPNDILARAEGGRVRHVSPSSVESDSEQVRRVDPVAREAGPKPTGFVLFVNDSFTELNDGSP
ncbi:MAG: hypothetical protein O3B95_10500 [Chloroflexi bacterium]|nr:hypothetical protein [Chloroflexota bacterium]